MQEVIMPFLYPRVNLYLTIVSGGGLCFIHKSSIWKRLKKLSGRSVFTITFCSLVHRETDFSELRCLRESSCVATRSASVMADVVLDQTAMMPGDRKAWWNYCILSSGDSYVGLIFIPRKHFELSFPGTNIDPLCPCSAWFWVHLK